MPRPVLLTCGATRNPVDAIRYLSANSSGRTGIQIALALRDRGMGVHLLGSAEALLRLGQQPEISCEEYTSTRDLMARMERWISEHPGGVVVHSAAVGDYEMDPHPGKIPSGQEGLTIRMRRAPKIADHILGWDPACFLVTFKAASPETTPEALAEICRAQRERTGSALVFGNVIGRLSETSTLVDERAVIAHARREDAVAALVERVVTSAR